MEETLNELIGSFSGNDQKVLKCEKIDQREARVYMTEGSVYKFEVLDNGFQLTKIN